ncbi:MAG: GH3 auxin-responsive promoter family protein, partial [Kamptonema sp. SIO4C4]|nr:GH3 auxin-responsive promoter family protein [Kamptonema sp. SIO4C4]
ANHLRNLFPNVFIQGKGLLATEAPLTLPLINAKGCLPLLDQVFFEFLDTENNCYQLHEIQPGKPYEIIISQLAGLYRYRIGDVVQVTHYYHNTPCLEFLGRTANTSDLVGEKLHTDFIATILDTLPTSATFRQLIPLLSPHPHYCLLLDTPPTPNTATHLETALMESYHYRQARLLGQLNPVQLYHSADMRDRILHYHTQQGKRWGDIKPTSLQTTPLPSLDVLLSQHPNQNP